MSTIFKFCKKQKIAVKESRKTSKPSKLTSTEDLPLSGKCESNCLECSGDVSRILSHFRKSKETGKCCKASQDLADISEMKMQMYTMMMEVSERDELIDILTAQIKIKDAQIAQLAESIHQEKLGCNKHKKNF